MAKGEQSALSKLYLASYNLTQFAGWSFCLYQFSLHVASKGSYDGVWTSVSTSVSIFQTLQLIEVLHCIIGLVPSSAFQTFIQILSRLIVVWGILLPVPESRESIGVPMLLSAWCVAEITRYLYYALYIYNAVPSVLSWCRYSFFILLYPYGVSGELLTMAKAIPYVRERQLFSFSMPNPANVDFHYFVFLILVMFSYIPFFPQLYFYMLRQRKKVLSGASGGGKVDRKNK